MSPKAPRSDGLLIYDGQCGLCTRCARFAEARWDRQTSRAVASQDLDDTELARLGLSRAKVDAAAWWITEDGAVGAERAVAGALARCGAPWLLLGWLITAPGLQRVAQVVYRLVVLHRHRVAWPRCLPRKRS